MVIQSWVISTHLYSNKRRRKSKRTPQVTQIFYGVKTVVNTVLQFLNQTDNKIDACVDQTRPSLTIEIDILKEAFLDAKKRGVKLRYITEITKDNLSYCKQLLTMVTELRHLDGVKGNVYLSETGYLAPATFHEKGKPAAHIIYSNVKEIIEHQRYVFDTLWTRAIPAEQRIEQIEEGVNLGRTEIIQNPNDIQQLYINMVKSAKHEVLLVLPTTNAFLREERLGIIELLKQAATQEEEGEGRPKEEVKHYVSVRLLTPTDDSIEKMI